MSDFRFPDGVEFLGETAEGLAEFGVGIPLDDDGHFGRECPSCEQRFRISYEDYEALPDDLRLWCVYCGHHEDHSEFVTEQQYQRLMSAAEGYAEQLVGKLLDESLGRIEQQSQNSSVKITYRSSPFYPTPLPGIDEERLVRERCCTDCELRYAVFGEHRFCPVCGKLPAHAAAVDALSAEKVRLDVLLEIPEAGLARLREAGVLDRTYVDTIENVVGIVEALAERVFRENVEEADRHLKRQGKIFQRLNDMADLFIEHLGVDARSELGAQWRQLQESWAARHVFTHCDGIVDAKYLAVVSSCPLLEGQRLRVPERMARTTIKNGEHLCRVLDSGRSDLGKR